MHKKLLWSNQKGVFHLALLLVASLIIGLYLFTNKTSLKDTFLSLIYPSNLQAASATDWAQVQKDPQRTGFTSENLGNTIQVKCTKAFQPERVYPQVQAIIYSGSVFIGTEMGNMYALDGASCATKWKFAVGSPVLGSAAADAGKVFFGALNGKVYALNTTSGTVAWSTQLSPEVGFTTSPVLAEGKLMIGGRDGKFYALNPDTGEKLWEYDAKSPILMTAAFDNGKAFFGTMDMYVHGVNTLDGTLAWKSAKVQGLGFKDYWPVVTQGKVIVVPWGNRLDGGIRPGAPFHWFSNATMPGTTQTDWQWLQANSAAIAAGNLTQVTAAMQAQNTVMTDFQNNPSKYSTFLYILDENTGQVAFNVPHMDAQSMHGATTPPCVDKDGKLIVPAMFIRGGWGRLDLTQKRIVDILYDGYDVNGQPMAFNNTKTPAGMGNTDENINVTCAGNMVLNFHQEEANAQYTGAFNQTLRRWIYIPKGWTNSQMSAFLLEAAGGNPPSISNGNIYHIVHHELIIRSTQ